MDGRCETCAHWTEFLDANDDPMGLGMCFLLSSHRHDTNDDALASIVGDDDDLVADFQTRKDFGCVQYERKDTA